MAEQTTFRALTEGISRYQPSGLDVAVTGVAADSRQVRPGSVFIAVPGYQTDGHNYIAAAIAAGAAAVVYQSPGFEGLIANTPSLRVDDARTATAIVADRFFDHPSGKMDVIAVTGTNGKTTTVTMLDAIFRTAGLTPGTVGTLGATVGDQHVSGDRTTPDAVGLQSAFARMVDAGVTHAAVEITSHALDLHRAYGTRFASAVFTNLSQDHLDWHHTMEAYFASKAVLFTDYLRFSPGMKGAVNVDDAWGRRLAEAARCEVITYGMDTPADVGALDPRLSPLGTQFELNVRGTARAVRTPLAGRHNIYNCLAAAAAAHAVGIDLDSIVGGLEVVVRVDGRLERVPRDCDFTVLVDYAHTPEALQNVLTAVRDLTPGRVICVFGCGGDRDRSKRPKMGAIAADLSDVVVVTSDNPRSEVPEAIIGDILAGIERTDVIVEPDRRAAISAAIGLAEAGDVVLLAGKGHETYQEFASGRIDFDDRLVAAEVIDTLGR